VAAKSIRAGSESGRRGWLCYEQPHAVDLFPGSLSSLGRSRGAECLEADSAANKAM